MADPFPRKGRDLRLDFFRGLSLFFIFIDHIPNNVLGWFTLRSIAFSDAAEVFIFISGYTAALVYGRSLRQHGMLFATAQVYRRVWQLYVAHIFLFVIFTAEVSYAVLAVNNPMYSEEMRVGDFLDQPHIAIIKALLLQFQPAFLDILPLYIVLLGTFPLVLSALERGPLWALLPSAALYALTLRHGWGLPAYPAETVWFFNPLAWQFLFVIGASAGHARVTGHWPFPHGVWLSQMAAALAGFLVVVNLTWVVHWIYDPFPAILAKQLRATPSTRPTSRRYGSSTFWRWPSPRFISCAPTAPSCAGGWRGRSSYAASIRSMSFVSASCSPCSATSY